MSICKTHKQYLSMCACKEPDKGQENGSCNRQACQKAGATWYNRGTDAWYCPECAQLINASPFAMKDAPPLCSLGKPRLNA